MNRTKPEEVALQLRRTIHLLSRKRGVTVAEVEKIVGVKKSRARLLLRQCGAKVLSVVSRNPGKGRGGMVKRYTSDPDATRPLLTKVNLNLAGKKKPAKKKPAKKKAAKKKAAKKRA